MAVARNVGGVGVGHRLTTTAAHRRRRHGLGIGLVASRRKTLLVASSSCPWSHGAMLAWQLKLTARLWRFTRRIYQMSGVAGTVDFEEIRRGYYLNDGSHNPFGLVADQPEIDWMDCSGL
jgi:glutathionyl-hydroquinone reductase